MSQIGQAYNAYLASASNAVTQIHAGKNDQLTNIRNLPNASIVILELGTKLGNAHRAVLENFLTASRQSINLVQNAADNIERHGEIILQVRNGEAELHGVLKRVIRLEVQDNGKGMSPEVEKRLFDPFFSTKESGAGLGLSIAARIVPKHHGDLEFKTQLECGTTFGIVLPIVPHET